MILFKKKKSKVPKSWKDMTIAKHKEVLSVYEKYRGDEDNTFFPYELVCAVYGKPWEWMANLTIVEANEYVKTIAFLGEKPKANAVKKKYVLNGHTYVASLNPTSINTAQYIDFQAMVDSSGEMPAEFLAIILIPEGKKYNEGYEQSDVVYDIYNYMTVGDALGLSAFFFNLSEISTRWLIRKLRRLERMARKEGKMSEEQLSALRRIADLSESVNGSKRWPL